jgi:hypothetical protein
MKRTRRASVARTATPPRDPTRAGTRAADFPDEEDGVVVLVGVEAGPPKGGVAAGVIPE